MCLSAVDQGFKAPPNTQELWAWKVFTHTSSGRLAFTHYHLDRVISVPRGKWLRARQVPLDAGYISGFHCFTTREGARDWARELEWDAVRLKILRVRIRGVHTQGTQRTDTRLHTCYVSKDMLVPLTKERKPLAKI